jgi:DNA-binding transcriptional MerR regulator
MSKIQKIALVDESIIKNINKQLDEIESKLDTLNKKNILGVLSEKDVREILDVSTNTLRAWTSESRKPVLKCSKIGNKYFYSKKHLLDFIKKNEM